MNSRMSARSRASILVGGLVLAAGVATPIAIAGGAAPADAPTTCEIQQLPTPENTMAATVDGSTPDGQTLVGYATIKHSAGNGTAIMWRDGEIVQTVQDAPSAMVDMNSAGDGVGATRDEENNDRSWAFLDGAIQQLPGEGVAHAIGESGQIVGSRLKPTSNGPPVAVPVMWPGSGQDMVDLPLPGNETGEALDIAADGTIVGKLGVDAYVWHPDGTHGPLPLPDGVPPESLKSATGINGPWVIGTANGPVRWNLETSAVERIPELGSSVDAVNEHGWTVGKGDTPGARGVVDGQSVELQPHESLRAHRPTSISADGKTFGGTAYDRPAASERPVMWRCP